MTRLKEFFEAIEYKITEGSKYQWNCFGPNAHQIDSWNGSNGKDGYTICCIFDTVDQTVYSIEAWDYGPERFYRWINPLYLEAFKKECVANKVDLKEASDGTNFIDVELASDLLAKAAAMVAGVSYDTRIQVPIELPDSDMLRLMKMAHERDITLNQLVEDILKKELGL